MARAEEAELLKELHARLELVNNDPEYEGEQATAREQWLLALVGLAIPLVILIAGWLIYA